MALRSGERTDITTTGTEVPAVSVDDRAAKETRGDVERKILRATVSLPRPTPSFCEASATRSPALASPTRDR